MELSKSATQGVGALVLVAVLAAAGFFVVKPQVEDAFALQTKTSDVKAATSIRELRLITLKTQSQNLNELKTQVGDLLLRIPATKDVTGIAGAVVDAMPAGVYLKSFSHGALDGTVPKFVTPAVSLITMKPPLDLTPKKPAAVAAPADGSTPAKPVTPPVDTTPPVPPLAGAPFILTVQASSVESLANFMDIMQYQKRLLTVIAVTSSTNDQGTEATIYAYAFAGSSPQIVAWEKANQPK